MNNMQIFTFDDVSVRTMIVDTTPYFVASDVATALGYVSPKDSVRARCRNPKQLKDILSGDSPLSNDYNGLDIRSSTLMITESDVYRLIITSRLPSAEKFEAWVMSEVLPSIRKTGSYSVVQAAPQDPVSLAVSGFNSMATYLGVPTHYAQIECVKYVQRETGKDFSTLLLQAPSQDNIPKTDIMLEPTELARVLGYKGPRQMNTILANLGLQVWRNGGWEPTAKADGMHAPHAWTRRGKSGYNKKWNVEKVKKLLTSN